MRKIRIVLRLILVLIIGGFLHYTIPQYDIARVTSTEIIRTEVSGFNRIFFASTNSGATPLTTRDLRLVNTVRDDEKIIVYRNEDTGWGWPPYLKFNSSDVQAHASEEISKTEVPKWVVIKHYGWRSTYMSIYPNILSITPIADPTQKFIPWGSYIILALILAAGLTLYTLWIKFRMRFLDPVLNKAEDAWDKIRASIADRQRKV